MIRTEAKKLIRNNQVKRISEGMYEVADKVVNIKSYKGRTEISCSCQNHSRFVNRPAICKHKLAALVRWMIA